MSQLPPEDKMKTEISFRPITEGLGFHPFSDGLPYAPVSKNTRTASNPPVQTQANHLSSGGSGAVAAGPPRLAPRPPISRVSVPVASSAGALVRNAPLKQGKATIPGKPEAIHPLPSHLFSVHYGWQYVLKRLTAYCIDLAFNSILFLSLLIGYTFSQESNMDIFSNSSVIFLTVACLFGFHWFFTAFQEVLFKSSFGKRALRMSLKGSTGLVFLRAFFFLPSLGFFGFGLLWSLFDNKKRCWHDLAVGIQPVEYA